MKEQKIKEKKTLDIVLQREFMDINTFEDIFIAVIFEDIKKRADANRTFVLSPENE